jgi:hypothetical protein
VGVSANSKDEVEETNMIETYATTKNGELIFSSKIGSLLRPLEGKELVVTIKTRRKTRTNEQNRYYWGAIIRRIAEATGNNDHDIHEFCKRKFLPPKHIVINGKEFLVVASTPDCNTVEFWDYVESIKSFFSTEFGIHFEDAYTF